MKQYSTNRKNHSKEEAMEAINKGFFAYQEIVNLELHYVYVNESSQYEELVINASGSNYMHLCGVEYRPHGKEKYNAKRFYDTLKKKNMSAQWLKKTSAETDLKLSVLPELKCLKECSKIRVIEKPTRLDKVEFPKAIRTKRQVFALGFQNLGRHYRYVPMSLLSLKTKANFSKGCQVHCVYSVEQKSGKVTIHSKDDAFTKYEEHQTYPYDVSSAQRVSH